MSDSYTGPVVKACSSEIPVVGLKAKRMDKVKDGVGCPAKPGNAAGVGWYLRLYEYYMERRERFGLVKGFYAIFLIFSRHSGHNPFTSSL